MEGFQDSERRAKITGSQQCVFTFSLCLSLLLRKVVCFPVGFWLPRVLVAACGLSLAAASRGCSTVAVCWLLIAAAPLPQSGQADLNSCGFRALEHRLRSCGAGLSCSVSGGIFPDQESKGCPLHCKVNPSPLEHQGSPAFRCFLLRLNEHVGPDSPSIFYPFLLGLEGSLGLVLAVM